MSWWRSVCSFVAAWCMSDIERRERYARFYCKVHGVILFRVHLWRWGTLNICSAETLINHTQTMTITANSPLLVITTLADTQLPVSFDLPSHQVHPIQCFMTDLIPASTWFIAPQLGHFHSSFSSAIASHFCFPALPLKEGDGGGGIVHW